MTPPPSHRYRRRAERSRPCGLQRGITRRVTAEPEHPLRTAFQRDRDRIVHSHAFRRLEYKTQVFVHHEGDHYRNRLTHTLEGAQIARTIARALRLNEDLAEAIALAHDLGHPPFGHAGERVLDRAAATTTAASTTTARRCASSTCSRSATPASAVSTSRYETREGILKHGANWEHPVPVPDRGGQTPLEAQVADRSDEIAYTEPRPRRRPALRTALARSNSIRCRSGARSATKPARGCRTRRFAVLQRADHRHAAEPAGDGRGRGDRAPSRRRAARRRRRGARGARTLARILAGAGQGPRELKEFLYRNLYYHPHVVATTDEAERVLEELVARVPTRSRQGSGAGARALRRRWRNPCDRRLRGRA